jgi:hypothetical protein
MRRAGSWALLLCLFTGAGCRSTSSLREAQDSFNAASAAENAARLNPASTVARDSTSQPLANLTAARNGYASTLLTLDKLNERDIAELKQNQLWGSALTLKALAQWRLGEWTNALTTAREAALTTNQLHPRDAAIIQALPGLVLTDQAYARIVRDTIQVERLVPITNAFGLTNKTVLAFDYTNPSMPKERAFQTVTNLLVGPDGAMARLASARATVDKEHPVQSYLMQSQLAAFANLVEACNRYGMGSVVQTNPESYAEARSRIEELQRLVQKIQPDADPSVLIDYWKKLCGVGP